MSLWDIENDIPDLFDSEWEEPEVTSTPSLRKQFIDYLGLKSDGVEGIEFFDNDSLKSIGIRQFRFACNQERFEIDYIENIVPGSFRKVFTKLIQFCKTNNIHLIHLCDHSICKRDIWGEYGFSGKKWDNFRKIELSA